MTMSKRTLLSRTWPWSPILILIVLIGATLVVGCKRHPKQSEVDQYLARYRDLPPAALADTLRATIAGGGPHALYAHYELGNQFYTAASESARTAGWAAESTGALLDSAQTHLDRAVAMDSTFVPALVNLGSLYDDRAEALGMDFEHKELREEQLDKAQTLYEKALQIDPLDEKAGCNLGSLYMKRRQPEKAIHYFRDVLQKHPDSALAHYNLAIMFAEDKIYREALVEWEAAAKADPHGDIGERSRENIKIVEQLKTAKVPENLQGK